MADYFSRHPLKPTKDAFLEELKESMESEKYIDFIVAGKLPRSVTMDEIREETRRDMQLQELLKLIREKNGSDSLPKDLISYKPIFHELNSTRDGILLRVQNVVIPVSLRARIADLV